MKSFKAGKYLNAWGKAWVAITYGKTTEKVRAMYKTKNGILYRMITIANAKKWNNDFKRFLKTK